MSNRENLGTAKFERNVEEILSAKQFRMLH
jgi:hypothetical protein